MSAHLSDLKLSYFSVPRCACTSIKRFFFFVENGFELKNFRINSKWSHIHNFYQSKPFNLSEKMSPENFEKYAVVRDPISRMVSCYRNRVDSPVGRNLMKPHVAEFEKLDIPKNPTWPEFLDYFDGYRATVPMVKHHSEPLSHFLGNDSEFFTKIYDISEANSFAEMVAERAKSDGKLGREQTIGTDFSVGDVSEGERLKIRNKFSEDYEIFGKFFKS